MPTIPPTALASWTARLIVTQDGYVDFVPDRASGKPGPDNERFYKMLDDALPINTLKARISELLRSGQMSTRERMDFTLLDGQVTVKANTNASAGYCYVVAWLNPEPSITAMGQAY